MKTRSPVKETARSKMGTIVGAVLPALWRRPRCSPRAAGSEAAGTKTNDTGAYDHGGYDADNDDEIAEQRFYGGVCESWGEDDGGYVNADEFDAWVDTYYGDYDAWDADNNDESDEDEFNGRAS